MKRIMIISVALAALIVGCSGEKKQENGQEKQAISVHVATVQTGAFTRVLNYNGTVLPWKQAGIIPDVSGRVHRILVREGQAVNRGQLLAELDTTTLELQEKQAEAVVAVAGAALKDARLNALRMSKLFERKAVSSMQQEKSQLALESALTGQKSAEATLHVVQHNLKSARMAAPFSGVITARHLDEGDMINPMMGAGPGILTLMDMTRVKIRINVVAEDIEKIANGQKSTVSVATHPGETFAGTIYSKTLAADPSTKTFQVEVQVENPELRIKPGVFADVVIEISRDDQVLLLPVAALLGDDQVVLFDQGKARKARVEVGQKNEMYFEILSGLKAGDRVVVEGNYDLKDGSLIHVSGEGQ